MSENGVTLVVVPARGGSKGIPRKNLCRVGGVSLVGRAVLNGLAFAESLGRRETLVIVDTDDEGIAAEGRAWGGEVPFLRPAELARDETPTLDSVLHLAARVEQEITAVRTILLLQPTSPLRSLRDIQECWAAYDAQSAQSVVSLARWDHPPQLAIRLRPGDGARIDWTFHKDPGSHRRQDLETAFRPSGSVYVDSLEFLKTHRAFVVAGETIGVELPGERSHDVDTALDLEIASFLLERERPQSLPPDLRMFSPGIGWAVAGATTELMFGRILAEQPAEVMLLRGEHAAQNLTLLGKQSSARSGARIFVEVDDSFGQALHADRDDVRLAFRAGAGAQAFVNANREQLRDKALLVLFAEGEEAIACSLARSARSHGGQPVLVQDVLSAADSRAAGRLAAFGNAIAMSTGALVREGSPMATAAAAAGIPLLFIEPSADAGHLPAPELLRDAYVRGAGNR